MAYRAEITPVLEAHEADSSSTCVSPKSSVHSPSAFNRLFAIRFPSAQYRDASLDDPDYQGIRARWFEPSVLGGVVRLGDYPVE
jgi:hypothetical protein